MARLKKVLIVDDEAQVRQVLDRALEEEGLERRVASDAGEALAAAANEAFSVAILDIRMPGHNGIWLLQQFKERYPEMAVIMLSGISEVGMAVDCLQRGADNYLIKPMSIDEVRSAARRAIDKACRARERREHDHGVVEALLTEKNQELREALRAVEVARASLEVLVGAEPSDGRVARPVNPGADREKASAGNASATEE